MEKEVYHLQQALQDNGYPVKVIEPLLKEKERNEQTEDQQRPDDNTNLEGEEKKKERTLYLPYTRGMSEEIERTCSSINNQEKHISGVSSTWYAWMHFESQFLNHKRDVWGNRKDLQFNQQSRKAH